MRHRRQGRKLGRKTEHRIAMLRNMTIALFEHERIVTTKEKAKETRRFAEKLITLAKEYSLHNFRLALQRLPDKVIVRKLFSEIAPRYKDRPGGYTRIITLSGRRLGDGGSKAILELVETTETSESGEEKATAQPARAESTAAQTGETSESTEPEAERETQTGESGEASEEGAGTGETSKTER